MKRFWCCIGFLVSATACSHGDRFEQEIVAFEEQDRKEGTQENFALFVGSSSIRLWETLASDMEGLNVLNRGFGGATLKELNSYWKRISAQHEPDLVVLYCGENDIYEGASTQETLAYFDTFMAKYQNTYPETPLIYIAMKPSPSRRHLWKKFQEADHQIKEKIDQLPYATFVDLSQTMFDKSRKIKPEIFKSDSLHMNALGYEGWTNTLRPLILKVVNKQNLMKRGK